MKQSEDLLKMLNGNVVIETYQNISKNMSSSSTDDELKLKREQFARDLESVFEIGAELSS